MMIKEIDDKLVSFHKPIKINYYGKLGIYRTGNIESSNTTTKIDREQSKYYCYACKKSISTKVASFCFKNKNGFKGKAYCYDCQNSF